MKKALHGLLTIIIVVLAGTLGYMVWQNIRTMDPNANATPTPDNWTPPPLVTPVPAPTPTPRQRAENAAVMTLGVVGDLVMHSGLNQEAMGPDGYAYGKIFGNLAPYFQEVDFAVATMETTLSAGPEYSGYPEFKTPDALASYLRDAGFDLINTATDHAMDSYKGGAERTISVLENAGLQHVGTYRSAAERNEQNGVVLAEVNGIKIAFLAYTLGTNGIPIDGFDHITNVFFTDYLTKQSEIDYDKIQADMEAANALEPDIIVTFMHWGNEYHTEPVAYQKELADFLFDEGADIIIGGHPHVPEPMEFRSVTDKYGREKTRLVAYSLGNFISCQEAPYSNLTATLRIEIEKNLDTGEAYLTDIKYAPLFMVDLLREEYGVPEQDWRYRLWDLHAAIASYEADGYDGYITPGLYEALTDGLDAIHAILGPGYDMFN